MELRSKFSLGELIYVPLVKELGLNLEQVRRSAELVGELASRLFVKGHL